jgi:acetylornithine deacetylase/succinyl-diaminopimelate desuccinylase-like protein
MDPWILDRQVELTAIPAPTFHEEARGRRMAELFQEVGLEEVRSDDAGNVLGQWPANPSGSSENGEKTRLPFIVSAHLDTVFPPGTDVVPRHQEARILAPGISDDGRGLAALLGLARVIRETSVQLPFPLLFVATVGEEGTGNLRGVRFLIQTFQEGSLPRGFISLDGVGLDRIIHRGVGSSRLRITLQGPGGHSWTDFGRPNPIHILGTVVARARGLRLPGEPRTTLTVSRWGGGTSINSIPAEAWVEVDLRSEGSAELDRLEARFLQALESETADACDDAGAREVRVHIQALGRRPAGATEPSDPLPRAAVEATRILGVEPRLVASSTDANHPMHLGIPAITMGAGGTGGGIHTLEEWYENRQGPEGILRSLLTLLILALGGPA